MDVTLYNYDIIFITTFKGEKSARFSKIFTLESGNLVPYISYFCFQFYKDLSNIYANVSSLVAILLSP